MRKSKNVVQANSAMQKKQTHVPTNKFISLLSDDDCSDDENINQTVQVVEEPVVEEPVVEEPVVEEPVVEDEIIIVEEKIEAEQKIENKKKHIKKEYDASKQNYSNPSKQNYSNFSKPQYDNNKNFGKKYDGNKSFGKPYASNSNAESGTWSTYTDKKKGRDNRDGRDGRDNRDRDYKGYKNIDDECDESKKGQPAETKKLYIEPTEYCEERETELGNTKFLNSPWTVWIHKANVGPEKENWTEDTYTSIYVINSIGSFWRFFNNFQMLDRANYQYFIMRNKIKPIWEDNENRTGSICSFRVEFGACAMSCMSLLIMNETFMAGNDDINGISYSIKNNKNILIKVWYKVHNSKIVDKIPIEFMNKLDAFIKGNNDKFGRRNDNSISIKYSRIEPQYSLE
jgi:hypothetical protein